MRTQEELDSAVEALLAHADFTDQKLQAMQVEIDAIPSKIVDGITRILPRATEAEVKFALKYHAPEMVGAVAIGTAMAIGRLARNLWPFKAATKTPVSVVPAPSQA